MTGRLKNKVSTSRKPEDSIGHWHRMADNRSATKYWFPNLKCTITIFWGVSDFEIDQPAILGGKVRVPLDMYYDFQAGELGEAEPGGGMPEFVQWCRDNPKEVV